MCSFDSAIRGELGPLRNQLRIRTERDIITSGSEHQFRCFSGHRTGLRRVRPITFAKNTIPAGYTPSESAIICACAAVIDSLGGSKFSTSISAAVRGAKNGIRGTTLV